MVIPTDWSSHWEVCAADLQLMVGSACCDNPEGAKDKVSGGSPDCRGVRATDSKGRHSHYQWHDGS